MALVGVGTSSTAGTVGFAAAVSNGLLVEVNASGPGVASDADAFATVVNDVLGLALTTPR